MASRESVIERLPMELLHSIMKCMDVNTLGNFMSSSKNIYNSFLVSPGFISHAVIENEIGVDCLPLAAARYVAQHFWTDVAHDDDSAYEERSIKFIEENVSLQGLVLMTPPTEFSLDMICDMSFFHADIAKLAEQFIEDSSKPITGLMETYPITPAEKLRFYKAFYISELALRVAARNLLKDQEVDRPFAVFWERFAPWECYQVNSLQTWLTVAMHRRIVDAMAQVPAWRLTQGRAITLDRYPALIRHFLHTCEAGDWCLITLSDENLIRVVSGLIMVMEFPCNNCVTNEHRTRYRLWLPRANTTGTTKAEYVLDPTKILEKYPATGSESDSGPQDVWFYNVMRQHCSDLVADSPLALGLDVAFPFWSRKRWDILYQNRLPTMEDMMLHVSGARVPIDDAAEVGAGFTI